MMRVKTFLFLILLTTLKLNAALVQDTTIVKTNDDIQRITRDLDSLANSWYAKLALRTLPDAKITDSVIAEFPDSVYLDRLKKLNLIISLPLNNIIRSHILVYTKTKVDDFKVILGLTDYYFPMIEDIFDSYGLPPELKYMAVIESALNPNAVSRAGATGMWQFMYSTGRLYGLTINSVIDERRDPVKATHAAAKYLKDMYAIFNDWALVIAAYNCGPGNVDKAIRRSGNKKDYWQIYYRLPRETRGYIPQYVAAAYTINNYREHRIQPLQVNMPLATDTVMINKDIHLSQISEVMSIPAGELRALNPQYKTGFIPGSTKPQPLRLPLKYISEFIGLNDTIRGYKSDLYLNRVTMAVNPSRSTYLPVDIKGKTKLYYTVKDGDNLGFISEWFKVGLTDLRFWNDIYGNTIRVGQRLTVFVDPSKSDYYSKINMMSFSEKQSLAGKPAVVNALSYKSISIRDSESETDSDYVIYTVQNGDTIWDIVRKFDSVSASEVLALNSISDPGKIQVGQKLKIKKKS
jgi:membrane-bound lytic murein transglycosylase D